MTRASLALLALALASSPSSATELWSKGDARIGLSGSLRELATVGRQTEQDGMGEKTAGQSLTRLRARLDVEFTTDLRAVVVYDNELQTGILDTFQNSLARKIARDDLIDAGTTVVDKDRVAWSHLLYRGFVQLETEHLDVSVGRQRVAWGVGRLWNPIDRFNAIPPLATQAGQSRGIDGIDAKWSFDGFHFVEAVYAPGRGRDHARYALRYHGVWLDSDVSIIQGTFEKAHTVGFDVARNIGDAAGRMEFVYTRPHRKVPSLSSEGTGERPDDFLQIVASLDYTFDYAGGIYLLVEHLYNGNALGFGSLPDEALAPVLDAEGFAEGFTALFGSSRVVTFAKNQTGFMLGGDITPELRLDLLTIYDWNGESAAFFPSLKYSPLAALEVTLGVQTFVGPRLSQFGSAETFVYLLADVFF